MPLATLEDINLHLPDDKIAVDDARYAPLQLDAERIVRGYMAGYLTPAVLSTWLEPETTPELIRAIAGRLVAALYYRDRFGSEDMDDPEFAQNKYNEAMAMIDNILTGKMVIVEVEQVESTGHITSADFYPNGGAPEPKFTMSMEL